MVGPCGAAGGAGAWAGGALLAAGAGPGLIPEVRFMGGGAGGGTSGGFNPELRCAAGAWGTGATGGFSPEVGFGAAAGGAAAAGRAPAVAGAATGGAPGIRNGVLHAGQVA